MCVNSLGQAVKVLQMNGVKKLVILRKDGIKKDLNEKYVKIRRESGGRG